MAREFTRDAVFHWRTIVRFQAHTHLVFSGRTWTFLTYAPLHVLRDKADSLLRGPPHAGKKRRATAPPHRQLGATKSVLHFKVKAGTGRLPGRMYRHKRGGH